MDLLYMSDTIKLYFDNSENTKSCNPPGFPHTICIDKDTPYENGKEIVVPDDEQFSTLGIIIDKNIPSLRIWYKEYGWNSSFHINKPYKDGDTILIPKVIKLPAYDNHN